VEPLAGAPGTSRFHSVTPVENHRRTEMLTQQNIKQ